MFFQFTPDSETLRRMQEAAAEKAKEGQATGPKMYQTEDGKVIIDDPSLVSVIGTSDEKPSAESLNLTSVWVPNVFSQDGSLGAWIPLSRLRDWQETPSQ